MKKHLPIIILFVLIVSITSLAFSISDNIVIRTISGLIAAIGILFKPLRIRFQNFNNKIEDIRNQYQLAALFLEKVEKKEIVKDDLFVKLKTTILKSNKDLLSELSIKQTESSLIIIKMNVESKEILSRNQKNIILNWRDTTQKQFTIITGKSGSGKSFELRDRFKYYDELLSKMIKSEETKTIDELKKYEVKNEYKIPIYIELKSLRGTLSKEWLRKHIKSQILLHDENFKIKDEHLNLIIENNEITYFLDALDEVDLFYREQALAEIIKLSQSTTVFFTCRTEVYEELRYKRNKYIAPKVDELVPPYLEPMEFRLTPLSDDNIEKIIRDHKFEKLGNYNNENKEFTKELQNEIIDFIKICTPEFKKQLTTPIFLNLFITVFPELTEADKKILISGIEEDNLDFLWSQYEVKAYRLHKFELENIEEKKLSEYTIWIAKIVGTSSFSAESIQPSWLHKILKNGETETSRWLQGCYFLITRIIAAMIIGLGLGCIISTPFTFLSNSVFGGTIIAFIAGAYKQVMISSEVSEERKLKKQKLVNVFFSFSLFICLIIGCGVFQGLFVPRTEEEMTYSFFSLPESYSGVVLGIALGAIFSYRIIKEKNAQQYILPVERFHFNWMKAIKYGISIGAISGIIVGTIAVIAQKGQVQSIFFNNWLIPQLRKIVGIFYSEPLLERGLSIAIFFYGFTIMFIVCSLIVTILVGPYNEDDFQHEIDKQNLNFNIKKSARKAFMNALQIAFSVFIIYLTIFLFFIQNVGGIYFATKIAFGFFILGFFWYGGMEIVNFIILQTKLNMLGIIPMSYNNWREIYHKFGLITTTGKEMRFYHDSVARFYKNYKSHHLINIKDSYNPGRTNRFIFMFLLIFSILTVLPYFYRYQLDKYWKESNELVVIGNSIVQGESNNIFICQKTGNLQLNASGYIHVGTFVGRVLPHGTERGFLGIKMDSAYNMSGLGNFRHAALLVRKMSVKDKKWTEYEYVSNDFFKKEKSLFVEKGDLLEFIINDREWQNNISRFKVKANIE